MPCGLALEKNSCMGEENEDGFSPGYVLLSFQTLTPPSDQPKVDRPVWDKTTPTQDRPKKILPAKEVDWKYVIAGNGGMNQNSPNTGLAPRWPNSFVILPMNGVKRSSPNRIFYYKWYWTPRPDCRQETKMREVTPAECIMLRKMYDKSSWRDWKLIDSRCTGWN